MSTTRIFLVPVSKKPAPKIRLGSARPPGSVAKARPPYFTAHVYTSVYYYKKILVNRRCVRVVAEHYITIIVRVRARDILYSACGISHAEL